MIKWFNINYYYIVLEYDESIEFCLIRNKQFIDYCWIKQEYGVEIKFVIVGFYMFVMFVKGYELFEVKVI